MATCQRRSRCTSSRTSCPPNYGATYRGKVPIAENVEAFLFDRGGVGILMIWDRGTDGGVRQLAVNLGQNAKRMDLWGNVSPVMRSSSKSLAINDSSSVPLEIGS